MAAYKLEMQYLFQKRIENGVHRIDLPVQSILEKLPEGESIASLIANRGTFIVEASVNGKINNGSFFWANR